MGIPETNAHRSDISVFVGDDWRLAGSAIASVGLSFLLAHLGMNVWWMLPILTVAAMALAVGMVARSARTQASKDHAARSLSQHVDDS